MPRPAIDHSRLPKLTRSVRRFVSFSLAPGSLLAIGLVCTITWWYTERQEILAGEARRFGEIANRVARSVDEHMVRGEQIIVGLAALAGIRANEATDFDWAEYVARLNLDMDHGALPNAAFMDLVEPGKLAAHEARQRARGSIGYRVVPEGDRPRYFPVVRFVPSGPTTRLGYDGYSDPVRRKAIDRALGTRKPAMTELVMLKVDARENDSLSYIIYVPVLAGHFPKPGQTDNRPVIGLTATAKRVGDLLADVLANTDGMVEVAMAAATGNETSLRYGSAGVIDGPPRHALFTKQLEISRAGQRWLIFANSTELFETAYRSRDPIGLLIIGMLGTMLVVVLTRSVERSRRQASTEHERQARQEEESRAELLQRLQKIASQVPGVVYQFKLRSDGTSCFPYASEGIRDIYRVTPDEVRDDASKVFAVLHPDDLQAVTLAIEHSARTMTPWRQEYRVRFRDATERWLAGNAVPERDAEGAVLWHGFIMDVTERKLAEEEIRRLAFFDSLTGLPNRRLLLDRLRQVCAAASRTGTHGALLFLDLDHFKMLNDTKGHEFGDHLLMQVAGRLSASVREGDTVSRLGGDEFVVMLAGLGIDPTEAASQAETVAEKILAAIQMPFQLRGQEFQCTCSIGVSLFNDHLATPDEVLKHADVAMYRAKASGRNVVRFFDPAMQVAIESRVSLEGDLRRALSRDQLQLFYQIQVNDERKVTGAEALLRWTHPEQGAISPVQFIPLAEETGLIVPIGQWVLETACAQIKAWARNEATRHLDLAINVSPRQFRQAGFVDQVRSVLERTVADPMRLKLELTESVVLDNVATTIDKMHALKAMGVGFSMDDFGTGYSSLTYLKRLPLDVLKIDRAFVRDIATDNNDAVIVQTILGMAKHLGIGVIAEGVETAEQLEFLKFHGCRHFQGYLFSRPLPLAEFERHLAERSGLYDPPVSAGVASLA
jgi:diguanylate cyclase (GGDEF)-like protein/PAS domain S-box-containing protein